MSLRELRALGVILQSQEQNQVDQVEDITQINMIATAKLVTQVDTPNKNVTDHRRSKAQYEIAHLPKCNFLTFINSTNK